MLTDAWFPLRYHEKQAALWRTTKKFAAVACGRGSGKTELARRRVVRFLPVKKPWPDPIYFYALPTFRQAKAVAWPAILNLIPKDWLAKQPNAAEMKIETVFGSTLYILGTDKPQRAEGLQYDGGVLDEASDQRPKVLQTTFMPALTHRDGWCWVIGAIKRSGAGIKDFRNLYKRGLAGDSDVHSTSWPSHDILTPEQVAVLQSQMAIKDFNEQIKAEFQDIGGSVFYSFSSANVRAVNYDPSREIIVGSDFNVDPMAWVLCHAVDGKLLVFDELFIHNTNTPQTLDVLYAKYGAHEAGWTFYGDAAGRQRNTAATTTNYLLIKNDKRFKHAQVRYPTSNPLIHDRLAACNALLQDASDERRCYIDPRCKQLISDLETRSYKEGTMELADKGDIGHITDAWGYIVHTRFPVTLKVQKSTPKLGSIVYA